jgi:TonB family protein
LASSNLPKPIVEWPSARTPQGYLISDCEPMNLKPFYRPEITYPKLARAARVSGVVRVEVVIDEEGKVIWAKVVEGHPLLQAAALRAACQIRIQPAVDCLARHLKVNTILYFNFKPEKLQHAQ